MTKNPQKHRSCECLGDRSSTAFCRCLLAHLQEWRSGSCDCHIRDIPDQQDSQSSKHFAATRGSTGIDSVSDETVLWLCTGECRVCLSLGQRQMESRQRSAGIFIRACTVTTMDVGFVFHSSTSSIATSDESSPPASLSSSNASSNGTFS